MMAEAGKEGNEAGGWRGKAGGRREGEKEGVNGRTRRDDQQQM